METAESAEILFQPAWEKGNQEAAFMMQQLGNFQQQSLLPSLALGLLGGKSVKSGVYIYIYTQGYFKGSLVL